MMLDADLFRNGREYQYAVCFRDERGEAVGRALMPGDEIYLTKDQQRQVARAPRRPEDNPFVDGTLVLVAEGADVDAARPIGTSVAAPPVAAPVPVSVPPVAPGVVPPGAPDGDGKLPDVVPDGDGEPQDVVGTITRESLEGEKRGLLNAKAKALGVEKPDQMGNKGEVIDAILATQG